MGVKIKTEFANTVIGFNNSALPLGQRDDLDILAQMALDSKNPKLLNLFEELPDQNELNQSKEEKILQETADVQQPEKTTSKKRSNSAKNARTTDDES